MKLATPRSHQQFVLITVLMLAGLVVGLIAPTAAAAPGEATASVLNVSTGAGVTSPEATLTLTPSSGQIGSFNASVPAGWAITSHPNAPGLSWTSTTIQGRGLMITTAGFSVTFGVRAPCASAQGLSSVATAWSVAAKTGPNFNGNSFSITPQPSTPLTSACTATFFTDPSDKYRGPADAALNGRSQSEPITSDPYTPSGDPMQVEVRDADGNLRGGITVELHASGGGGSEAAGDTSETTGSDPSNVSTFGIAIFGGPVTLANIGQGYIFTPTGAFDGVPSAPFGIYQEGEPCDESHDCVARGHSANNRLTATVSAPLNGTLGVLITSDPSVLNVVSCTGFTSPFTTTQAVTVWKYTGDGSQTIVLDVSKQMMREVLDRGANHIEFCFDSEGKPFRDKFGEWHWDDLTTATPGDAPPTDGLLSDCNAGIDPNNCILSETAFGGGGRRITVIVVDGRGKI